MVSNNIHIGDAIGNFILYVHDLLQSNKVPCRLYYSGAYSPELEGKVYPISELYEEIEPTDILIVNFSIFLPELEALSQLKCYKAAIFYGITPPKFLQAYQPELADHCLRGYQQGHLLDAFDQYGAISESAARALQKIVHKPLKLDEIHIIPPLVDFQKWSVVEAETIAGLTCDRSLLYVGRVVPHKRVEDLIKLFAAYSKLDEAAHLVIVGSTDFAIYKDFLDKVLSVDYSFLKDKVHFLGMISDGQLKTAYQSASALVMMSEHEGFCIPLVEAMHFQVPVFAYGQEAVRETLGRSGKVFYEKAFDGLARDVYEVLSDPQKQQLIVNRQTQRLQEMQASANGSALWKFLEAPLVFEDEYPV
ncbi:MAG: glycosyltransferase [Cyanobacteria bacterium Co-bin13]|nr:glycosyltransferase [Cyanobacteria bacterium Co-bin13]